MGWARALAACGARADGGLTTAARLVDALEARAGKAVRAGSTFVAIPGAKAPSTHRCTPLTLGVGVVQRNYLLR